MTAGEGEMRERALMDVGGWEAFLHGVFAIAITLLVLDIHVPPVEATPDARALIDALTAATPHYIAYVIGFLYLGTYWIATHRTLRQLRGVDHWFLVIGLVYLMVVSVLPFGTALLAAYIGENDDRAKVALVLFTTWQLILSVIANISIRYATWNGRLLKPGWNRAGMQRWLRIVALGPVIWAVALLSAIYLSGTITLILTAGLLVLFLQEVPVAADGAPVEPAHHSHAG